MCTKNRFLHGSLVFLHEFECSTVIGRCCADHPDAAEREYEAQRLLRWQEDYLLEPHIVEKKEIVANLRLFVEELQRVYRKVRREAPAFHAALRNLKERNNARLSLFDEGEYESSQDYVGPAGYIGSASKRGVREVFFGWLQSTTLLIRDYKPVAELDDVHRNLSIFDSAYRGGDPVDFVAQLSAVDRRVAVAALQLADKNFAKFEERAKDALEFFSPSNIQNLLGFGAHNLNGAPFSIELKTTGSRYNLSILSEGERCFVAADAQIFEFHATWKTIAYEPFRKAAD
jgi:hypothetical protein